MTAGQRHIQTVETNADLPFQAQEGDQCWVIATATMSVWTNGGWESLAANPTDIFATLTYDYDKAAPTLDIPETYTQVGATTSPSRSVGVYEVGFSATYEFPDTNDSAYLRFRINGGTWNEFVFEQSDIQDRTPVFYQFPFQHPGGPMSVEVEMRKENALANQLDCLFCDTWFRRVQ